MPGIVHKTVSQKSVLVVAALVFFFFLIFFTLVLRFDLLQSDPGTYWEESFNWKSPFSTWYVPAYPLLIAAFRWITGAILPPEWILILICLPFYLVGVSTTYRIAEEFRWHRPDLASIFFAVFPFVGLTYTVFPVADGIAIAVLLLAALFFHQRRWVYFAFFSACAMMTHKATWFFVPVLQLAAVMKYTESRRWVIASIIPLILLFAFGVRYHGDWLWMVRWSTENLLLPRSSLPVFDGVVGPFLSSSPAKWIKGAVVVFLLLLTITTLIYCWRHTFWLGCYLAFSLLLMFVFVNQYEIWAAVRFSKVLIVPSLFVLGNYGEQLQKREGRIESAASALIAAAFLSNLAYAYYMANFFF